jgi:hypothetical protein
MQIDIQVPEAHANELLRQFNLSIEDRRLQGVEVVLIKPLPGAFGVEGTRTVRVKATLSTAAQIASILSLCLATYVGVLKDAPVQTQDATCIVKLTTGQVTTEAQFPCSEDSPVLKRVLEDHIAKHGPPTKVQVKPPQFKK